jgi:hypothetical protein
VAADLRGGAAVSRARIGWAVAPAVLVAVLCAVWRVTG